MRAARRRALLGKQDAHQDSGGTGGAAAGFHGGGAEAPAGGPAGVRAAHFTCLQQENERKGAECHGLEGRTWGNAGAAAGGQLRCGGALAHRLQEPGAERGGGGSGYRGVQAPVINRFTRRASVCAEVYNPDEEDADAEPRIIHSNTDDQKRISCKRLAKTSCCLRTWMGSKHLKC